MEEKQRILISDDGHWDDIIKLPCFRELRHRNEKDGWQVVAAVSFLNEVGLSDGSVWWSTARPGDYLVEYVGGAWGIARGKEAHHA